MSAEVPLTNEIDAEVAGQGAPAEIPPLTRNSYFRQARTIEQIRRVVGLSWEELLERMKVEDETHPEFLGPETIAFLIRRHRLDNDQGFLRRLLNILMGRCIPIVQRDVRGFDRDARNDIVQDTLESLVRALTAADDRGDFAQAQFWSFLKKLRLSACAKHNRYMARTDQLDEHQADALSAKTDYELSPEQLAQLGEGRLALDALPPHLRQAFVMRHYFGFKIGPEDRSKEDPNDPSIAAHFDKSRRTIQNWLTKANELLSRFQKE
jgi:DNA-directed RNA polymerase specialized sigma24 family protein